MRNSEPETRNSLMKTIYTAVMARLKEQVPAIRWIDFDKGQLDSSDRPAVAFPCALISIGINNTKDITSTSQDCTATLKIASLHSRPLK